MKNDAFIYEKNIYYILSKKAEPALYFIVKFPLCKEPEGKSGLAHVSEHVMLSLIENGITGVEKSFGFFAYTGYSAIQFNFSQLHNEENIINVYNSILQAVKIKTIDKTILKSAKEHVLKECRELKLKYSLVLKENKFLTGYKTISLPVGKVKDVKSINENDVIDFICKNYTDNWFLIVNKNKIKPVINNRVKTVAHNKNIFKSSKINTKYKKKILHIAVSNPKHQEIAFCITINKNIFKAKYYYFTLLQMYIIDCMNVFFKNKNYEDEDASSASLHIKMIDDDNMIAFINFNSAKTSFQKFANELIVFICRTAIKETVLKKLKSEYINYIEKAYKNNIKMLIMNVLIHIEYAAPLIITDNMIQAAKRQIKNIDLKTFCSLKNELLTKENFKMIIEDKE